MSASQDKKKRVEARGDREFAAEQETRKQKKTRARWIAGTIAAVLLIAVILVGNSSLFYSTPTAVKIGDMRYSPAEVNYYYQTAYYSFCDQYGNMLSYMGLNVKEPLDKQKCTVSKDFDTWDDYFRDAAIQSLTRITALSKAAEEAGMTLSDDDRESVEEQLATIELTAKNYGYGSASKYLTAAYGDGVTKGLARKLMEQSALASAYAKQQYDSYTYTDEQIAEAYAEHADEYDTFDCMYYLVQAEKVTTTDGDGKETEAVTDETMAAAKQTADRIAAAAKDADSFTAVVAELGAPVTSAKEDGKEGETTSTPAKPVTSEGTAGKNLSNAPYAEWIYDSARQAGDVTVAESEDVGYYVVLFQGRDQNTYNTVSVRHILIKAEDTDGDKTYSDEEKAAAKKKIDEVYQRWLDGEQTEEAFAALAESWSEDSGSNTNGGLYENIYKGQMVKEFNDFCFAEGRKPGDVEIVYGESTSYSGYHLVYFVGEGARYCDYLADQLLRSDDYNAWEDELVSGWTAEQCRAMKYVMD